MSLQAASFDETVVVAQMRGEAPLAFAQRARPSGAFPAFGVKR